MPTTTSSISNFGVSLFNAIAGRMTQAASPLGKTVTLAEMKAAIAALSVDGFSQSDKTVLSNTFASAPKTSLAARLFADTVKGTTLTQLLKTGDYATLSGTIKNEEHIGIGGEAPPSGSYLVLDTPVKVDGKAVSSLFLGYKDFPPGANLQLHGRIDKGTWGGTETAGGSYSWLSGISNITAKEPKYDGKFVSSVDGAKVPALNLPYPTMIADAPGSILVLDAAQKKAFVGSIGGFIPAEWNEFHGFSVARPMVAPSTQDVANIRMGSSGFPRNLKSGDELVQLSAGMGPTNWFFDKGTRTAYEFNGSTLSQKVQLVKGDFLEDILFT